MEAATQPAPVVTVAHSPEEGTTISGDTRSLAVVIKSLGGWRWYAPKQAWYRIRSLGAVAPTIPLERWADALRKAGAVVTVECAQVTQAHADAVRREQLEARADRLAERAAKHSAEASARFGAANRITDGIPMGQPILVGHHSERRHRRDLERAHANVRKGIAAQEYAETLERRANAAASEAERLSDENRAGALSAREWVTRLSVLISRSLKRTVGAVSVRCTSKGMGQRLWWNFGIRRVDDSAIDLHVSADTVTLGVFYGERRDIAVAGRTPEEVFRSIVDALGGEVRS